MALRYSRPRCEDACEVTAMVAVAPGIGSAWMKRFPWRLASTPAIAGALLWTRPPTTNEVARGYEAGQLVGLPTAQRRGLPVQPCPIPTLTPPAHDDPLPSQAVADHSGIPKTTANN